MNKTLAAEIMAELSVANIIRVYRNANESQMARGLSWYADAHTVALALDPHNVRRAAGIIAALSPRMDWDKNVIAAARVYAEGFASGCLTANARKADRIFAGETPLDVLGGDKVRAFYGAIVDPSAGYTVIDRHAFDVAIGRVTDDETRSVLGRKGAYDFVANLYREAAAIIGVSATVVQAVTWTVWRETESLFVAANLRALEESA
jgi:hypothetical protein